MYSAGLERRDGRRGGRERRRARREEDAALLAPHLQHLAVRVGVDAALERRAARRPVLRQEPPGLVAHPARVAQRLGARGPRRPALQPLRRAEDAAVARGARGRQDAVQRLRGAVQVRAAPAGVPAGVQPHVREHHPLQLPPQGAGDAAQEGGRPRAVPGATPGRRAGRRVVLSRRCTFSLFSVPGRIIKPAVPYLDFFAPFRLLFRFGCTSS